jgi:hypothetical protein
MLETITLFVVTLASKLSIISTATQSAAGSLTMIVASIGAVSLSVSGALAWLATILPIPTKPNIYSTLHKYINIFGGNVGNAANALKKASE